MKYFAYVHKPRVPLYRYRWWITILLAVYILIMSLVQIGPVGGQLVSDKLVHAFAYALLAVPTALSQPRALIWFIPLAILFGGVIELIQPYFGRDGDIMDFIANIVGVTIGSACGIFFWILARRLRR